MMTKSGKSAKIEWPESSFGSSEVFICNFVDRKFQIAESPRPRRGKTHSSVLEIITIIT